MNSNETMSPRIRFLGAAGTVTGSRYLLTLGNHRVLVDCGLFQGLKELRLKNWDRFPIDPASIDAIVLTHAHIDHSGYIPRLIKEGFRGKVYCTPATLALCRILLPDTGFLQEEEAEYLNRRRLSKHRPALPLFTKEDAEAAVASFTARDFNEEFEVAPGIRVKFHYSGHILGAAQALFKIGGQTVGFSGDLGRSGDPIFLPPAPLPELDFLIIESTYGNRKHEDSNPLDSLARVIEEAASTKGVVLIPAFAVGRAQTLMYFLYQLRKAGRIPDIPMYLNSPMATTVTDLFCEFKPLHRLTERECVGTCEIVRYVRSVEESKALNEEHGPMVIISASGMATGGRILHHLKAFAPDPKNTILLAGFQAAGTRGRAIQDGALELKIHRELVPVRARVRLIENLSAHADASEIVKWIADSKVRPKKIFVTHGEPVSAKALGETLETRLGLKTVVPIQDQEFILE